MKTENEKLIVAFHIGRGGKYYNAGNRTFAGEKNLQTLINNESNNLYYYTMENGLPESGYYDCNNNLIISEKDAEKDTGRLEFDGDYDTLYCKDIHDCDEQELKIITESKDYKSPELENYLNNNH